MRRRETLAEQLDAHEVNRDVARAMRRDQAELFEQVCKMLDDARKEYNHAAAMHSMGKVSHYGGKIAALEAVLKLI